MASLLVSLGCSAGRAGIDAQLNTSNFVSGQASEVSIDGIVTSGGSSTSITGAALTITFDPAEVSLSGFGAGAGWSLQNTNTDNLSQGWVKAVLSNTSNDGAGQTATGPILYFTVTPANAQVDPDDCGTLRFAGVDSDLSDQEYVSVYPSDPCDGQMARAGSLADSETPSQVDDGMTIIDTGGIQADNLLGCAQEFPAAIRALKIASGLTSANQSGDPNYRANATAPFLFPPLTQQDQATLEMIDPGSLGLAHNRHITITDAIMILRERYTGPSNAVWAAEFLGNALDDCGGAANAVGMPAIAQLDGYDAPEAIIPMGTINGQNYYPTWRYSTGPQTSHNPNAVYVLTDTTSQGHYAFFMQWPKQLSDAPAGVAVADLEGSGHPQVIASCFQDQEGYGLANLFSRAYVWNYDGAAVVDGDQNILFPTTVDPTNTSTRGLGHAAAAPVAFNVDNDPDGVLELLFSTQGQTNNDVGGEFGGGIQFIEPDGSVLYSTTPSDTPATSWRVGTAKNQAEFVTPPVMARSTGGTPRFVVAGAYSGDVYAWQTDSDPVGQPRAGFPVQTDTITAKDDDDINRSQGRAIVAALIAGDVNGGGNSEIIAGCGRSQRYYSQEKFGLADTPDAKKPMRYDDGFVYCWNDAGEFQWRYPKDLQTDWNGNMNGYPAMDAG